jgi:hypothetical protein
MEGNLWMSACNLFDEMASNDYDEWRSSNRNLEITLIAILSLNMCFIKYLVHLEVWWSI